jgi:hypothetical protein
MQPEEYKSSVLDILNTTINYSLKHNIVEEACYFMLLECCSYNIEVFCANNCHNNCHRAHSRHDVSR